MLQFGALPLLRSGLKSDQAANSTASAMFRVLIVQQVVFVACPALFMAILLTTDVVRTLRLRFPAWPYLLAGCVAWRLHSTPAFRQPRRSRLQKWFFPPMSEQVTQIFRVMSNPSLPLWIVVLAMAVAPGVCEELAFRGFILSGFLRSARLSVAIVLSSIAFGVAHMVPQQVFNAALLGLVLGLIAVRSGSLWPGVLFHVIYNSLEILRGRVTSLPAQGTLVEWFMTLATTKDKEHVIEYRWPTLALAGVVACVLIAWLVRSKSESARAIEDASEPPSRREPSPSPPTQPPVASR